MYLQLFYLTKKRISTTVSTKHISKLQFLQNIFQNLSSLSTQVLSKIFFFLFRKQNYDNWFAHKLLLDNASMKFSLQTMSNCNTTLKSNLKVLCWSPITNGCCRIILLANLQIGWAPRSLDFKFRHKNIEKQQTKRLIIVSK